MSRSRRTSAPRRPGSVVVRHVRIHHWLMRSAAWQSLSCEGRAVLVELYALFDGSDNGRLFLSIREAASRVGVGKSTAAIALAQRYNMDSRDQGASERLDILSQHDGIWGCTFVGDCTRVCPKDVDPAGAIQQYKLTAAREWIKALLMPWGGK